MLIKKKLKVIKAIIKADYLDMEVLGSIPCYLKGKHEWVSEFNPKEEITKPINQRVYCKHCGIYYDSAKFHH